MKEFGTNLIKYALSGAISVGCAYSPSVNRDTENNRATIPVFVGNVLVPPGTDRRRLPEISSGTCDENQEYYLAYPIVYDRTEEAYKPNGKKDNLWLSYVDVDGIRCWLRWLSISRYAVSATEPDIVLGSPAEDGKIKLGKQEVKPEAILEKTVGK